MANRPLTVTGFSGSLRQGSYNRALLHACVDLAPTRLQIEPFDIRDVPLYNADLDNDDDRPDSVRGLKKAVARADAVLLASPEYNYGVSGVMKNALDWASRPAFDSPFYRKPVGIMGASRGLSGTMRGQEQLKLNLLGMASLVFPHPGVAMRKAGSKFDDEGRLVDEDTIDFLQDYLEAFADWLDRIG